MTIEFKATYLHAEINQEDGILILGLSNGEYEYDQYVLFQRALDFDEQDIQLGMNTYHFEVNGQEYSNYGACKKIGLNDRTLDITIDPMKIDGINGVKVNISDLKLDDNFLGIFRQILQDHRDLQIKV